MKKLSALLVCIIFILPLRAQTLDTDPLVSAMREELRYNMDQLKDKPTPVYFMSLRMNDTYSASVSSNFGISMTDEHRSRTITPHIRVGSPELDNFKYECQTQGTNQYGGTSSLEAISVPFTDGAVMAVRQGIWSETMKRYSASVNALNAAASRMMTNADNEDKAPCFSDAPVELYYEEPLPQSAYTFDLKAWEERLDRVSGVFKGCPGLEDGIASIDYTIERIYVVNSDGSAIVENRPTIRLMLSGDVRATDGMICPLYRDWFAYSLDMLPTEEVMIEAARDLVERFTALREAPIADPYAGPAIMSGSASGVFFHEIFGHRLEAHRMKSGGQTFKKLVGELVLPECFQVYDDPSLDFYAGTQLYGYYKYDDEAVRGQRVNCVQNGVLREFLMDRTPIDGFPASNGHGRASEGKDPVSRQSNLIIETREPYTEAQMRDMLISEIKRLGKEYGYYFRTATSGLTYLGDGGSINSFGVDPVEVYQVFADGRPDRLVRGVTLIGTPLAMFSGIAAGGNDPTVFTGQCGAESGWVPVTAVSPMIYITKVETQRSETGYQLPQTLPAPEPRNVSGTEQEIIFSAIQDELERSKAGFQLEGQPSAFQIDCRINSSQDLSIGAALGGIYESSYKERKYTGSINVQLGDTMITNDAINMAASIGEKADYNMIRRILWQLGDAVFKNSINGISQKQNQLKGNPKPEDEAGLPEYMLMPAREYIGESVVDTRIDRSALEDLAKKLSAVYLEFPEQYNTSLQINVQYTDIYRMSTEGLKLRLPFSMSTISTYTSVRSDYGAEFTESYVIPFDATSFDADVLAALVREFAQTMQDKSRAVTGKDFYIGPILLENECVSESFSTIFNEFGKATTTWSPYSYMQNSGLTGSMVLGKKILDEKLGMHLYSDMKTYKGQELAGYYTVDFDGLTPPSDFTVFEKGMLKNMICARTAAPGAVRATGHGRIPYYYQLRPQPGFSIMHITSEKTVPYSKMKARLIAEARKNGLDHAYIQKNITYNCYLLIRVDVRTGKEELVQPDNTPEFGRMDFKHVLAVSREEKVSNFDFNYTTGQLSSIIAPKAIILESIEMQYSKPSPAEPFQLTNPAWR